MDEPGLKTWELPGCMGGVQLPTSSAVEYEDEETLLASFDEDLVVLRFSRITVQRQDGDDEVAGKTIVREKAEAEHYSYYEVENRGICSCEAESADDETKLLIRYWYVGEKNTVVIVSATMAAEVREDPGVRAILDRVPPIVESIAITKVRETMDYEGEEVSITRQTVEPQEQEVAPFDEEYEAWLQGCLEAAAAMAGTYGGGGELAPAELDVIFGRWMAEEGGEKESGSLVANALGAAFGQYLVDVEGFQWVVVTDAYGSDVAVRHPVGQTTAFPIASVAKRIEANDPDCFQGLRTAILSVRGEMGEETE